MTSHYFVLDVWSCGSVSRFIPKVPISGSFENTVVPVHTILWL